MEETLTIAVVKRLETGPLRINGDWASYFLRGRTAMEKALRMFAAHLNQLADEFESGHRGD
jgi:hypothetical protein